MGHVIQLAVAPWGTNDYKGHDVYALHDDGKIYCATVTTWTRGSLSAGEPKWKLIDWPGMERMKF